MFDELVKRLRERAIAFDYDGWVETASDYEKAADAMEKLSAKVESLQFFADSISRLPDCNTCFKKNLCEFKPKLGDYCRINCPAWLGKPPKEG